MIEINNLTTSSVDEGFLKNVTKKILEEEKQKNKDLSIALVGQGRIRELNKRYRGKNRVTDVLAFGENKRYKIPDTKYKIQSLGEVVVCLREVKKNAKKYGSTYKNELARVLIHGILHLFGYNHEKSEKEIKIMEEKQQYYLSKILNPKY